VFRSRLSTWEAGRAINRQDGQMSPIGSTSVGLSACSICGTVSSVALGPGVPILPRTLVYPPSPPGPQLASVQPHPPNPRLDPCSRFRSTNPGGGTLGRPRTPKHRSWRASYQLPRVELDRLLFDVAVVFCWVRPSGLRTINRRSRLSGPTRPIGHGRPRPERLDIFPSPA